MAFPFGMINRCRLFVCGGVVKRFCAIPSKLEKKNFIGMGADQLAEELRKLELKETVSGRVFTSVYDGGISSFQDMPEGKVSKIAIDSLSKHFSLDYGSLAKEQISDDGTRKWLVQYGSHKVESKSSPPLLCNSLTRVLAVFIPSDDLCQTDESHILSPRRKAGTICISSQVGCTVGCTFCFTGTQKISRNLNTSEIVGQVMTALRRMDQFGTDRVVQNIVFMGQGEPFYNYANVVGAIHLLGDPNGLCFSKKRITVSTSGVVPMIRRFSSDEELETVQLAISLHAVRDEIRDELVPVNRQWPLKELMAACRDYHQKRRLVFEYVMLRGVNDTSEDAKKLIELLQGLRAVVNLIPFNAWPGSRYECSHRTDIIHFHDLLQASGIPAPIRWPRGDDILAACGQLQTLQDTLVGPPVVSKPSPSL
jgi:23S rRNA (adenine2503-C2)-methyltransferase